MNVQSRHPLSQFAAAHRPAPILPSFAKPLAWITFLLFLLIIPLFACSIYGFTVSGSVGISLVILATCCLIAFIVAFIVGKKQQKSQHQKELAEATKCWLDRNDLDFDKSEKIRERLAPLLASALPPSLLKRLKYQMLPRILGCVVGEVSSHFDRQTQTLISGWLEQKIWVGLRVGREELLGDSFIAVLDQLSNTGEIIDTVRVVVPSEFLVYRFLMDFVSALGQQVDEGSHCQEAISKILSSPPNIEVSRAFDRLKAILRMPPEERKNHKVSIIGVELSDHILLGEAIGFGNEPQVYNLFPISFCMEVKEIADGLIFGQISDTMLG